MGITLGFIEYGILILAGVIFAIAGDRQLALTYLGLILAVGATINLQEYECQRRNQKCRRPRQIKLGPATSERRTHGHH